jgi:hypothetical protein
MNNILKCFSVACLFAVLCMSACKDSAEATEQEVITTLLSDGKWAIQSVSVDGIDRSSLFSGLVLDFEEGSYTSVNGKSLWPASGSWRFTADNTTSITRNDGLVASIAEIGEEKLILKLTSTSTSYGPGRVSSIAGEHTFTFVRTN